MLCEVWRYLIAQRFENSHKIMYTYLSLDKKIGLHSTEFLKLLISSALSV